MQRTISNNELIPNTNVKNPLYRGDSRDPTGIFVTGFEKKDNIVKSTVNVRFDFDQFGMIATSSDINAAAAFPMCSKKISWIYVVKPDQESLFDVCGEALRIFKNPLICAAMEWSNEYATDEKIYPHQIIAAIKIERSEHPCEIMESYQMIELTQNIGAIHHLSEEQLHSLEMNINNKTILMTSAPLSKTRAIDRLTQASLFLEEREKLSNVSSLSTIALKEKYNRLLNVAKKTNRSGDDYRLGVAIGFFSAWNSTLHANHSIDVSLAIPEEILSIKQQPKKQISIFQTVSTFLGPEDATHLSSVSKETEKFATQGLVSDLEKVLQQVQPNNKIESLLGEQKDTIHRYLGTLSR